MSDEARLPGRDAPLEPDPMLERTLADRYRIDALVARGGMARVYRARDLRLDRDVAVKVLAPPYGDDAAFTERFLGEARAAASLSHPSLVHVYDSGSDGLAHFIVMELLDRHRTLRDVLSERGSLPVEDVIRIGGELLAGLRVVHERGLVHCDVKAANIMLGAGPAKLIDFGIAQHPSVGLVGETSIGTLQAMSPEQLHGEALTPASDLFSLGTVLYEALTGRVAYPGTTPQEVSRSHAGGGVAPPSTLVPGLSDRLDAVILQSLRRDPDSRFRSAPAMARALDSVADATSTTDAGPDDETRVVAAVAVAQQPGPPPRDGGYVPPPAPAATPQPAPRSAPPSPRRAAVPWGTVWTLLVLAAVALVVLLIIVPLLTSGGGDPGASPGSAVPSPSRSAVEAGLVPSTVGLATQDAIALAEEAGLAWTVRCNEDQSQPEGIVDQEPPPGTQLAPGAPFTMFSARIEDCR
jgi:tRNA A-37 threonylcarbamoyl transferase component Bud32